MGVAGTFVGLRVPLGSSAVGHERLGLLPKSKKWRNIVAAIGESIVTTDGVSKLVSATSLEIESRFSTLGINPAVHDCFTILVALSIASRAEDPSRAITSLGYSLVGEPTPLNIARLFQQRVRIDQDFPEYAQIARSSAIEAVSIFYDSQTRQGDLLGSQTAFDVWRTASDGAGFCELSRQFFASLTTGHLEYILEREASASLPNLSAREVFQKQLRGHVDDISRHSFETAKIAQSFAAGWYNKNAREDMPSPTTVRAFLRTATKKIKSSLSKEGAA
jgi:hypothetical protein